MCLKGQFIYKKTLTKVSCVLLCLNLEYTHARLSLLEHMHSVLVEDLVPRLVGLFSHRTLLILVETLEITLHLLDCVPCSQSFSQLCIFCSNKNVALDCVAQHMFSHQDSVRTVYK